MSKFLLVGLGNIGAGYDGTRHNIGFDLADAWAAKHEGIFTQERLAYVAKTKWKGKIVICIKPTTYMNLSGKAVKYWIDKEGISLENVLATTGLPSTSSRKSTWNRSSDTLSN